MKNRVRVGQNAHPDGSTYVHSAGYIMEKSGDKWVMQRRLVMEQQFGRVLAPHERVHHKNGDRKDNRPENLELWTVGKDPTRQRAVGLAREQLKALTSEERRRLFEEFQ